MQMKLYMSLFTRIAVKMGDGEPPSVPDPSDIRMMDSRRRRRIITEEMK